MATRNHIKVGRSAPSRVAPRESKAPPGRFISVPAAELQQSALRLRMMRSVVLTTVAALDHQAADHDPDFAHALHHCVAAPLLSEIQRLENLFRGELA